jgi:hypothetical protein
MPDGVARKSQADHLVDLPAGREVHIGPPGTEVGRRLAAELAIRRDHQMSVVARSTRGGDQRPGDDEMPALADEGWR